MRRLAAHHHGNYCWAAGAEHPQIPPQLWTGAVQCAGLGSLGGVGWLCSLGGWSLAPSDML